MAKVFTQHHFSAKEKSHHETWWKEMKKGDRQALQNLFEHYSEILLSYGISLFKNRELVKDSIQDVFIDLWHYRNTLSPTDNVKLYLLKSLRTKILRNISKYNRAHDFSIEDANLREQEWNSPFESEWTHGETDRLQQQKLQLAILRLPARQKEVLRCIFYESMSYEETSYLMSMKIKSVYNLIWRAISNLKKHITSTMVFLLLQTLQFH